MRNILKIWVDRIESRRRRQMDEAEAAIRPLGLNADDFDRCLALYSRRWRRVYWIKNHIFAAK